MQNVVIVQNGPGFMVRALYFVFLGWWLGILASSLAWFLNVTIVGLPLGLYIINRLPGIITMRPQNQWNLEGNVLTQGKRQRGFLLRTLWFVLVGWWMSAVWLFTAYLFLVTIILMPIAFIMYTQVGAVTTLRRD